MLHAAENLSPFFAESFSAIADAKAHAASIRENDISVIVSAVPDDAQAVVLDARIRERRGKLPTIRMISYRCASVVHLFLLRACVGCVDCLPLVAGWTVHSFHFGGHLKVHEGAIRARSVTGRCNNVVQVQHINACGSIIPSLTHRARNSALVRTSDSPICNLCVSYLVVELREPPGALRWPEVSL